MQDGNHSDADSQSDSSQAFPGYQEDYTACVRGSLPLIRWNHVHILSADAQESCCFGNGVMTLKEIKQESVSANICQNRYSFIQTQQTR